METINNNYSTKVFNIKSECLSKLQQLDFDRIVFFDFNRVDWMEDDEYYDLPQSILYAKYGGYDLYYLHTIYKESGHIYVTGKELENNEDYEFSTNEIDPVDFAILTDLVISRL